MKNVIQSRRIALSVLTAVLGLSAAQAAHAEAWSFGVMADTQQTGWNVAGENGLNTVSTQIIAAVNQQFINAGVKFVVQVGDLCDSNNSANAGLQTRLNANANLNAAGIAFYGLRGNHESGSGSQTFFKNNYIPASSASVPVHVAPFDLTSYAVTYNNTKIVLLDYSVTASTTLLPQANAWMNTQLSAPDHTQAFVFQHKNLLGQNHKDNFFGSGNDPAAGAPTANANEFFRVLAENGVRYDFSGHDHMHHRALVTSPDGLHKVQQIIAGSDSTKFYDENTGFSNREVTFADEQYKITYYTVTVDGPRVSVNYYATPHTGTPTGGNGGMPANPVWTLKETFGYSLNGKQYTIAKNQSYADVDDAIAGGNGYLGTAMEILDGANVTTAVAEGNRDCADDLNTGWATRAETGVQGASDVLHLWGMNNALGSDQTDLFVLAMSVDMGSIAGNGTDGQTFIASLDDNGNWVNTVSLNFGGTPAFVSGAYAPGMTLGTYGFDAATHKAWAVVNHNSQFVVVPEPASFGLLALGAAGMLLRRRSH